MTYFIIGNGYYEPEGTKPSKRESGPRDGYDSFGIDWGKVAPTVPIFFINRGNLAIFKKILSMLPYDEELVLVFHYGDTKLDKSAKHPHEDIVIDFEKNFPILKDKINFFSRTYEDEGKCDTAVRWCYCIKNNEKLGQEIHTFTQRDLNDSHLTRKLVPIKCVPPKNNREYEVFEQLIGEVKLEQIVSLLLQTVCDNLVEDNEKKVGISLMTPGYSGSYVLEAINVKTNDIKSENFVVKISQKKHKLFGDVSDRWNDKLHNGSHSLKEIANFDYGGYQIRLFEKVEGKELKKVIGNILGIDDVQNNDELDGENKSKSSNSPDEDSNPEGDNSKEEASKYDDLENLLKKVLERHQVFFQQYKNKSVYLKNNINVWKGESDGSYIGLSPTKSKILSFIKTYDNYCNYAQGTFKNFGLEKVEFKKIFDSADNLIKFNFYPSVKSYIHGDLHTRNIFIDENGGVSFIDFDLVPDNYNENTLKDYAKLAVYVELEMIRYIKGAGVISASEEEVTVKQLINKYTKFVTVQKKEDNRANFEGKIKLIIDGVEQIFECANNFLLGEDNKKVKEAFEEFCEEKNFTPKQLLYFQFNLAKLHYYIKVATYDTPVVYQRLWCMKAALLLMEAVQKFDDGFKN